MPHSLYFTNRGEQPTPILSNIQGIDTLLRRGPQDEFTLHYQEGSTASPTEYQLANHRYIRMLLQPPFVKEMICCYPSRRAGFVRAAYLRSPMIVHSASARCTRI